jgi:hypothetical protein
MTFIAEKDAPVVCGEAVTLPTSNSTLSDASALVKATGADVGFEGNASLSFEKAAMFMP